MTVWLSHDQYDRLRQHEEDIREEVKECLKPLLEKYPELELSTAVSAQYCIGSLRVNSESYFKRLGEAVKETNDG